MPLQKGAIAQKVKRVPVFTKTGLAGTTYDAGSSWTHRVGFGSNQLLVICLASYANGYSDYIFSSVTFNGIAATRVIAQRVTGPDIYHGGYGIADVIQEVWYLVNPPSGSYTVAATLRYTPGKYSADAAIGISISYTSTNQASPVDASSSSSGNSLSPVPITPSITLSAANELVVQFVIQVDISVNYNVPVPVMSWLSGQTDRLKEGLSGEYENANVCDKVFASAGNQSMNGSIALDKSYNYGNAYWGSLLVAFKAVVT